MGCVNLMAQSALCYFMFLHAITRINASVNSELVYNGTETLAEVMRQHPNITSASFIHLSLTSTSEAFRSNHLSLRNLDLSHNRLAKLDTYEFCGLLNLETLSLANNRLTDLPLYTFQYLEQVLLVNLSHNHLHTLIVGIFDPLVKATELILDHNLLTNINFALFKRTISLKNLKLRGNQISDIQQGDDNDELTLQYLDMSYNQLGSVNFSEISNLRKLNKLDLSGNNLTGIVIGDLAKRFPQLKIINIEGHKLDNSTLGYINQYFDYFGINPVIPVTSKMNHSFWLVMFVILLVDVVWTAFWGVFW